MSSYNPRPDPDALLKIRKAVASQDYAITLARIRWDFFATLTFAGTVPRESIAYGLAFRWLRGVAEACDVKPYKRLISALRGEFGELGGRFHFHCLVGGTNTRNYITAGHALEHRWKVITNGGRVEVRQYNRTLAGAEYVSKCLGANDYEAKKYAFANSVTLSHSVYRIVAGLDATMERRCCQHTR